MGPLGAADVRDPGRAYSAGSRRLPPQASLLPHCWPTNLSNPGPRTGRQSAFHSRLRWRIGNSCGLGAPRTEPTPSISMEVVIACAVEVGVVIGRVRPTRVLLNRRGTFLYTEYGVRVERWIRPESGEPSITLLRGGGRVRVGGVLTEVVVVGGREYDTDTPHLLILAAVPRSSAYILRQTPIGRRPIGQRPSLIDDLREPRLVPNELERNEITFERFVEDVNRASVGCDRE